MKLMLLNGSSHKSLTFRILDGGVLDDFASTIVVHECSNTDQKGAEDEGKSDLKVKQVDGDERRENNRSRVTESLQDVIRILEDHGNDEAAHSQEGDGSPGPDGVTVKERSLGEHFRRSEQQCDHTHNDAPEGEPEVSRPDGVLAVLEHLLHVDASETGGEAENENGDETQNDVVVARGGGRGSVELDEDDAAAENDEGNPLHEGELLMQEKHAEKGGGEKLDLGGDLEDDGLEVGDGDVHAVVLDGVEESRNGVLHHFLFVVHSVVVEGDNGTGNGSLANSDKEEGEDELHDFAHENGSCGIEFDARQRGSVLHRKHLSTCEYNEQGQAHIFHVNTSHGCEYTGERIIAEKKKLTESAEKKQVSRIAGKTKIVFKVFVVGLRVLWSM